MDKIIDTVDNNIYKLNSNFGKKILKNYIRLFYSGSKKLPKSLDFGKVMDAYLKRERDSKRKSKKHSKSKKESKFKWSPSPKLKRERKKREEYFRKMKNQEVPEVPKLSVMNSLEKRIFERKKREPKAREAFEKRRAELMKDENFLSYKSKVLRKKQQRALQSKKKQLHNHLKKLLIQNDGGSFGKVVILT